MRQTGFELILFPSFLLLVSWWAEKVISSDVGPVAYDAHSSWFLDRLQVQPQKNNDLIFLLYRNSNKEIYRSTGLISKMTRLVGLSQPAERPLR